MHLRGEHEESALMVDVLRRHGLPVLPTEIGFSEDEFVKAVEYAPQTRPGRYTILEHLDLSSDAIRDAYADYAKAVSQTIGG
jgi:glycerol-1-phosphate dehydrogenase [NAD(P)+]